MKIIDEKKYYDSKEFRVKISESIMKHSKELDKEIKSESQFIWKKEIVYV